MFAARGQERSQEEAARQYAVRVWLGTLMLAALAWGADDTPTKLQALSSASLAERQEAERWLASHLSHEDYPQVAGFVAAADAEARTRLGQALAGSDAHLELAVLLSADGAANARRAGDAALRQMVRRWTGAPQLEPKGGKELWEALERRFEGVFALDFGAGEFDESLECLARRAPTFVREGGRDARLAIVLDPPLAESLLRAQAEGRIAGERSAQWSEGSLDVLLRELARSRQAYVEVFGLDTPWPWAWVHASPSSAELNGADLLRHWCRNVVAGRDRLRGEAAARALAQSGWPAPLVWLSRLWREDGDRNALAGLLVAAGRGRIATGLVDENAVSALLAEFEAREREGSGPRWERFRREFTLALAQFPAFDLKGAPLSDLVAKWADREGASEARRACAAQILAGMRRAPPKWLDGAFAALGRGAAFDETYSALRLAAALERKARAPWALALSPATLERALERRVDAQMLAWSEELSAAPPHDAAARERLRVLEAPARALWIDWVLVGNGAPDPAAPLVLDWARDSTALDALAERLQARVRLGDGARIAKLLELARADAQGPALERLRRLAVLAGTAPMLERQRWFEQLSSKAQLAADDWALLGALAHVGPSPLYAELVLERAKAAVVEDKELESPWIGAFAHAYAGVNGRGDAELAERMRRELWVAVRRAAHPLRERMEFGAWPPPPGPAPIALSVEY
mgnify:CR=1 FL=1